MAVQIHLDYPPGTREANTCSACHAGHRMIRDDGERVARPERIVDFFVNIDFEGFLMLCEQCVLEAAAVLGWVSPAARDEAVTTVKGLLVEVAKLTRERDEAAALVRSIRTYDEKTQAQVDAERQQAIATTISSKYPPEPEPDPEPVVEPEPVRKTKARTKATA